MSGEWREEEKEGRWGRWEGGGGQVKWGYSTGNQLIKQVQLTLYVHWLVYFYAKKKKKIDSARSRSGHAFTVFSSRAIAICTITLYYRTKRGVFFSPLLCFSR